MRVWPEPADFARGGLFLDGVEIDEVVRGDRSGAVEHGMYDRLRLVEVHHHVGFGVDAGGPTRHGGVEADVANARAVPFIPALLQQQVNSATAGKPDLLLVLLVSWAGAAEFMAPLDVVGREERSPLFVRLVRRRGWRVRFGWCPV
nr:hypothetical protein CFP56_02529 [Quercus suber]